MKVYFFQFSFFRNWRKIFGSETMEEIVSYKYLSGEKKATILPFNNKYLEIYVYRVPLWIGNAFWNYQNSPL